tara:strand:- start:12844 stop:13155 length:312 start_codon:yes stop_codon:yes gene_type:complete
MEYSGKSRMAQVIAGRRKARLPSINKGRHLIEYFSELGYVENNGMGFQPISFKELQAFSSLSGVDLDPLEVEVLRRMSKAYIRGYSSGKDPFSIPPWVEKHGS